MQEFVPLDSFDLRLLAALQEDGAMTNAVLADRVGLSSSQVSRRRQALEEAGVIKGYRVILEPEAVGLGMVVFIHVSLATHSRDNAQRFRDLVRTMPNVLEAYALTGEADYLLKVVTGGLKDLSSLVNETLLPHESVERVRSEVVLDILKETSALPLG